MDKKKILIIAGFVLFVAVIGFLLYYFFFRAAKPVQPAEVIPPVIPISKLPATREAWDQMTVAERARRGLPLNVWPGEEEPVAPIAPEEVPVVPQISEIAEGGKTWINPVGADPVSYPTASLSGSDSIYYNSGDGRFYKLDQNGQKTLISQKQFFDVKNVSWAPTKDRAVIEYPDGFKIMYDFSKDKQYTLPQNWSEFSWNSVGSRLAFKMDSQFPENRWLAVSNPDGTRVTPIEAMGDNADKVIVNWSPAGQVVAFSKTGEPRDGWQQEILLVGQNRENYKSIIVEGRGFLPEWAPQGDKIAYSVYISADGFKPSLYVVDATGGDNTGANKIDTNLNTWADKCVFSASGASLYCAVPKNLPDGSGLFRELADDVKDDFYRVDIKTGVVSFLAEGALGGYNATNLYLSADESALYFVDKDTSYLKSIKLK